MGINEGPTTQGIQYAQGLSLGPYKWPILWACLAPACRLHKIWLGLRPLGCCSYWWYDIMPIIFNLYIISFLPNQLQHRNHQPINLFHPSLSNFSWAKPRPPYPATSLYCQERRPLGKKQQASSQRRNDTIFIYAIWFLFVFMFALHGMIPSNDKAKLLRKGTYQTQINKKKLLRLLILHDGKTQQEGGHGACTKEKLMMDHSINQRFCDKNNSINQSTNRPLGGPSHTDSVLIQRIVLYVSYIDDTIELFFVHHVPEFTQQETKRKGIQRVLFYTDKRGSIGVGK